MSDIRLIDANALLEFARNHVGGMIGCNDIARFPTIDAVQVVRCRDCVLWKQVDEHCGKCPFLIGEHQYTGDDHFCSLAEKMDGGAD